MMEELLNPERVCARRIVIVTAHPDDEVIGAGGQLHHWTNVHFIHVTTGSPVCLDDARNAGCKDEDEYAALRRTEFESILETLSLPAERADRLRFRDQEASFHLTEITRELRRKFAQIKPDLILTHPYEGGHPDHDATAFAVHQAAGCVPIIEMAGYHAYGDQFRSGQFLQEGPAFERTLTPFEQTQKIFFFSHYKSQAQTLSLFRTDRERFRLAPAYDFLHPPHPGQLYYEKYPWRMTASLWTELARKAK
jgi:LmbE family N-acetylglucosaminyl deacetylase